MSERIIEVKWWQALIAGAIYGVVCGLAAALGTFMAFWTNGWIG